LAPDPVPGARHAPRPGVPARRTADGGAQGPSSMATALPPLSPLIWAWAQAVHPDIQRWTFALSASVDEATAVILLGSAWRPLARLLLLQFLALALVVDLAANIPFDPEVIVGYSLLLLLLVAYPELRRLLTPSRRGPIDLPLLAMAVIVGAFFVPAVRAGSPGPGPGPGRGEPTSRSRPSSSSSSARAGGSAAASASCSTAARTATTSSSRPEAAPSAEARQHPSVSTGIAGRVRGRRCRHARAAAAGPGPARSPPPGYH
jgi:hypothetical protein